MSIVNGAPNAKTLYDAMEKAPDHEWSEDIVLKMIDLITWHQMGDWGYVDLYYRIPERCKSYKVCQAIVAGCPTLLTQVPSNVATQSFYEAVVKLNGMALFEVPRQHRTTKVCNLAFNNHKFENPSRLELAPYESQTEKMILAAIHCHGGEELELAAFQTHDICMKAVKMDSSTIVWVKNQTPEICDAAIQKAASSGGQALRDVLASIRNHTLEVCREVLRHYPLMLEHLRNQQEEVCFIAIQFASVKDVSIILTDIREQTVKICIAAYRKATDAFHSIRDDVMRRHVVRLVMAEDVLMPICGVNLSTSLLTEVCEHLLPEKFPPEMWENLQLLTPPQLWALAAKVKHAV